MPATPLSPEPLEQIHELNRLFLRSLQSLKLEGLRRAGFPPGAASALRSASPEQLDAAAEFPRALFELALDEPASMQQSLGSGEAASVSSRILELTIAYCAWTTSRDSTYHARLFFGLGSEVIHTFRTTSLSKLPWLAMTRARIGCAFQEAECLWKELLVETRPEARRQLVLVALQPPFAATRAKSG